jgi:hypothetical protein
MEHEHRKAKKSLQPNKQWTKHAELHRRIPKHDMPKTNSPNKNRNKHGTINPFSSSHNIQKRHKHSSKPLTLPNPLKKIKHSPKKKAAIS